MDKKIKKVGMSSEGGCGKYPVLIIQFEDDILLNMALDKESFYKLKNNISHIDIPSNRWVSDGCDADFEFKKDNDKIIEFKKD